MDNSNQRSNIVVLIPFDLIFNDEFGLIKLIKEKYYDKSVFNHRIDIKEDNAILYYLKARPIFNPLYNFAISIKDKDDLEELNSFYREFMDKEYSAILDRTIKNNLYEATVLFLKAEGINMNIWCRNKMQADYIDSLEDYNATTIVYEHLRDVPLDMYNTIYLKYFDEFTETNGMIKGKNIYVSDYAFNIEGLDKDKNIILSQIPYLLASATNEISLVEINHLTLDDIKNAAKYK